MRRAGGLIAILAVGAAARYWGIAFGLPYTQARPDESRIVNLALSIAGGDLNPHYFVYPTLYLYLLAAAFKAQAILRGVADAGALPYERLLLTGRVLTAAFGSIAVPIVYALARRAGGMVTGLAAAALLAVAFLHVRDSHFATTDVPMTCLVVADVLLLVMSRGRARDAAVAGLVAGLATSVKYNAALLVFVALALDAHAAWTGARTWRRSLQSLGLFVACMGCGFLAGTPYASVDRRTFAAGLAFVGDYLQSGHVHDGQVLAVPHAAAHYLTVILPAGVGWGLCAAGIAGLVLCVFANLRVGLALGVFPLVYFLTAARGQTVFARYMIPVVPFLCIGAAYVVHRAVDAAKPYRFLTPALGLGLFAALAVPTAAKTVRLDALLARPDNRLVVSAWMEETLKGRTVCETGSRYGRVHPDSSSAPCSDGGTGVADYVVVQRSPLALYSSVLPIEESLLTSRYVLIQTFHTGASALRQDDYDPSDAFFVPLRRLDAVRRPGPEFEVYELRRR
jgi:uncharacterized membrane protein